jgi:hypothetical protein
VTLDPRDPDPQPRPRSLDPGELGFQPQPQVAWLAPRQLAGTAVRVLVSAEFGAYLDKRELQNALPAPIHDEGADEPEAWLDYVADVGDGFNSTYSVAYLLAQPSLTLDGASLPRGRMLLMGGDEVYPTASSERYEDRTKGPYRAALPSCPPGDRRPHMYALPGNHDWYDGLTAFLRLFAKNGTDYIGGWRNVQARSYFAIRLPHKWWLMAIDAQFGTYLDDPQMHYFLTVKDQLRPGDRVILCPATPGWVETDNTPDAYNTIDYFVRNVLSVPGVEVKLLLSGDLHHYAHYCSDDAVPAASTAGQPAAPRADPAGVGERHLVTCGGGGAYLYPTHRLPQTLEVPPLASRSRRASPTRRYRLQESFPTPAGSRRFAAGVFARLPLRNPGFAALLGVLHLLYMLALLNVVRFFSGNLLRLSVVPVFLMGFILLAGTTFFAVPPTAGRRRARHYLLGVGHGAVHLGLGVAGAFAWAALPFAHWGIWLSLLAAVVLYGSVVTVVGTEVVCLYLMLASSFGVNVNELYAGQGIEDAKCFLRMHIGAEGLTIYPVAIPTVCRKWTANPDGAEHQPWVEPAEPLDYELAGPVIRIR